MSIRWKQIIPYLAIPLLLVAMFLFLTTRQTTDRVAYSEVIELFEENQVAEYTLNLSSGELQYRLQGSNERLTYTVPNVNMFISDIEDYVKEFNANAAAGQEIRYDYERGSANSWWVSLLPTIILMAILGVGMYIMMRKMNQAITSETNRSISFGKARIRNGKDEKRRHQIVFAAGYLHS